MSRHFDAISIQQIFIPAFTLFFLLTNATIANGNATFEPRISMDYEYTDNIFLSNQYRRDDLILFISPGFTANFEKKNAGVSISYDIGRSYYQLYSEYNTLRHNASFLAWWMFSKQTELRLNTSFLYSEDPFERNQQEADTAGPRDEAFQSEGVYEGEENDPLAEVSNEEYLQRERNTYYKSKAQLSILHWLNRESLINIGYDYEFLESRNALNEDETGHQPYIRYSCWPIRRIFGIDTFLSYHRKDFSETIDDPASWEEEIASRANVTWWMIPQWFKWVSGVAYMIGVADDENKSLEPIDNRENWYETARLFSGGTYWINPKTLWLNADLQYEKGISYSRDKFSDPADDYDEFSADLKISRRFNRFLEGYVEYEQALFDFRGYGRNSDYTIYHPSIGIEYRPDQQMQFSFGIGYLVREKEDGNTESAITLNGGLSKPWQINYRTFLEFDAESGYDTAYYGAQPLGFGFYYNMDASLTYLLSKFVRGEIYGSYERNRYIDNQQTGERIDLDTYRDNTVQEVGVGLVFMPGWKWRWLTMRIDYLFRDYDSTLDDYGYEENRLRWQIIALPPKPYRLNM